MSKYSFSRASAILVGIFLLTVGAIPALAQVTSPSAVRPAVKGKIEATTAKRPTLQQGIASNREKIASKAAVLKSRLETFKNQQKATVAEKINANLDTINQNRTAQMQKHLERMTEILNKLEARVNSAKPDIKDPAAAKTAIEVAKANISSASAAVSAQALKDYTITVTSEGRIGLDVKKQRDALQSDLQTTRLAVQNAKQSVANAIRIAKSGSAPIGSDFIRKEGTPSGQ